MSMKRILILFALLAVISCGPSRHAVHVEMRYPSRSGLELGGKIVSMAYSVNGDETTDRFNEYMADSFAKALEQDYGTGEGSVKLLKVDANKGNYSHRDSLVNLLMNSGADLVLLIGIPEFQTKTTTGALPLKLSIYCYDAMNKDDKVQSFVGSTMISSVENLESEARGTGKQVSDSFVSLWKNEQYSIAYYDSNRWYEALIMAEQYDWKGAMEAWFNLLDTNDQMKRAAAEYNIAVACYMLGDYQLADEWLKKSKADNDMPTLTDALRKRIDAKM